MYEYPRPHDSIYIEVQHANLVPRVVVNLHLAVDGRVFFSAPDRRWMTACSYNEHRHDFLFVAAAAAVGVVDFFFLIYV